MNVLMLLGKPYCTDSRVIKEIVALCDNGHSVTLVYHKLFDEQCNPVHKGFTAIGIECDGRSPLITRYKWQQLAYRHVKSMGTDFDVIHCHDLDTLDVGIRLKNILKIPVIYDCHDSFILRTDNRVLKISLKLHEARLIYMCDTVITVSRPMHDYLSCSYGVTSVIVRNCSDIIMDKYSYPVTPVFTVLYSGSLTHSRYFPDILYNLSDMKDIRFVIASRNEGIFSEVKELSKRYKNIWFVGSVDYYKSLALYKKANVVLAILRPESHNYHMGVPVKCFEAFAHGRPVIVSNGSYVGKIVKKHRCGILIDDPSSLKSAINYFRNNIGDAMDMGKNGLKIAQKEYNWGNESKKLLEVYNNVS